MFVDHATVHRWSIRIFHRDDAAARRCFERKLRQSKYLNKIVEQDHRAIVLAGIETMHMIKKGAAGLPQVKASSAASPFYSLAWTRRPKPMFTAGPDLHQIESRGEDLALSPGLRGLAGFQDLVRLPTPKVPECVNRRQVLRTRARLALFPVVDRLRRCADQKTTFSR